MTAWLDWLTVVDAGVTCAGMADVYLSSEMKKEGDICRALGKDEERESAPNRRRGTRGMAVPTSILVDCEN